MPSAKLFLKIIPGMSWISPLQFILPSIFFFGMKLQLFKGCRLALTICFILLFSNTSILLPFLKSLFTCGIHFLSASSMSPKSLHAICKDLTPLANPFSFLFLFFFFLPAFKYSLFYVVSQQWWYLFGFNFSFKDALQSYCACIIWTTSCMLLRTKSRSFFCSVGLPNPAAPLDGLWLHLQIQPYVMPSMDFTEGKRAEISFTFAHPALVSVLPRISLEYIQTILWSLLTDNIW